MSPPSPTNQNYLQDTSENARRSKWHVTPVKDVLWSKIAGLQRTISKQKEISHISLASNQPHGGAPPFSTFSPRQPYSTVNPIVADSGCVVWFPRCFTAPSRLCMWQAGQGNGDSLLLVLNWINGKTIWLFFFLPLVNTQCIGNEYTIQWWYRSGYVVGSLLVFAWCLFSSTCSK